MQRWLGQNKNLSDLKKMMTGWKTEMKNCGIVPSYPFEVAPHFIWMKGMELPPCFVNFVGHMNELKGGEFAPSLDFMSMHEIYGWTERWGIVSFVVFMGMHGICGWTKRWGVAPNLIFVIKPYFVGMNDVKASLVFGFGDRQGEYACNEWLECMVREMDNWNKMCKNCPYFERRLP